MSMGSRRTIITAQLESKADGETNNAVIQRSMPSQVADQTATTKCPGDVHNRRAINPCLLFACPLPLPAAGGQLLPSPRPMLPQCVPDRNWPAIDSNIAPLCWLDERQPNPVKQATINPNGYNGRIITVLSQGLY